MAKKEIPEAAALEIARLPAEAQYRLLDWVIDGHHDYSIRSVKNFLLMWNGCKKECPETGKFCPHAEEITPQSETVRISIRCDTILDNWDDLTPSLQSEEFVPQDGVILPETELVLHEGDTVFDVLELTAAAAPEHGAGGTHALLGGRQKFFDLRIGDIALAFEDPDRGALAGQKARHKESDAVRTGDPLALRSQRFASHGDDVVLFHARPPPFCLARGRPAARRHCPMRRITPSAARWQRKII